MRALVSAAGAVRAASRSPTRCEGPEGETDSEDSPVSSITIVSDCGAAGWAAGSGATVSTTSSTTTAAAGFDAGAAGGVGSAQPISRTDSGTKADTRPRKTGEDICGTTPE